MSLSRHQNEAVTVEVEVTEVDGVRVDAGTASPETGSRTKPGSGPAAWAGWRGSVRSLDSRWWPLWVLLGIIVVVLALTVGLALAAVYLATRAVSGIIRWIAAILTGSPPGGAITRR